MRNEKQCAKMGGKIEKQMCTSLPQLLTSAAREMPKENHLRKTRGSSEYCEKNEKNWE